MKNKKIQFLLLITILYLGKLHAQISQSWLSILNPTASTSEYLAGSNPQNNCSGNGAWIGTLENYNFKLNNSNSRIVIAGASNCSPYFSVLNTNNGQVIYDKYLTNLSSNVGLGVAFDGNDNLFTTSTADVANTNTYFHKFNNVGVLQFSNTIVDAPNTINNYWNVEVNQNSQVLIYGKACTNSNPYNTAHVKSFNLSGVPQWSTSITDLDWFYGYHSKSVVDNSGNIIFGGKRQINQSSQNSYDIVIKKVSSTGITNWQIYYDFNNLADYLSSIATDANGDVYLLTKNTNSWQNGTTTDRLIKLNGNTGAIIFQMQVGNNLSPGVIKINSNGTVALICDNLLKCYNSSTGNLIWSRTLINPRGFNSDSNGNLFVTCNNKIRIISSSGSLIDSVSIALPSSTILHRYVIPEPSGNNFYVVAEKTTSLPAKVIIAKYCFTPQAPSNSTPSLNLSVCSQKNTTLTALGSDTLKWYASPTSTTSLGTGTIFTTPILNTSITYYVASKTCVESSNRTAIIVNVLQTPTITVNSGTICNNQSFTILPSGANTYSYQGGNSVVSPSVSSSFSVVGSNTTGCISSAVISTITVFQNPTITINSANICAGNSVNLTANGASTFTWNTNATTSSITVNPTTTTNYTVSGTSNNCTKTQTTQVKVIPCTGIYKIETAENLSILPNPNNGEFTIESDNDMKLRITDQLGRFVAEIEVKKGANQFRIENLNRGLYFFTGQNNDKVHSGKMMIN